MNLIPYNEEFTTIKSQQLAKIEQGMIEHQRVSQIFGRLNSQTTLKLMSLTMLCNGKYRLLRQCAAEIESRKQALHENMFSLKRSRINAEKAKEESLTLTGFDKELKDLEWQELELQIQDSKVYVEGALKDIAALQDAYEQIKKTHNIPDNWDEADFEADEIVNHVKQAFLLAYRDMSGSGRIGLGTMEYLQQFGIHPETAKIQVMEYINSIAMQLQQDNIAPNILHLYTWLDKMYEFHKNGVNDAIKTIGLVDLITKWSLYSTQDPN